jgi:hypothetical protein
MDTHMRIHKQHLSSHKHSLLTSTLFSQALSSHKQHTRLFSPALNGGVDQRCNQAIVQGSVAGARFVSNGDVWRGIGLGGLRAVDSVAASNVLAFALGTPLDPLCDLGAAYSYAHEAERGRRFTRSDQRVGE